MARTALHIPVITIDGPSGAGKGTVAVAVARALHFHFLDSGAVYRVAALHVLQQGSDPDDEETVVAALEHLQASFEQNGFGAMRVKLGGADVNVLLRDEKTAAMASRIAALPGVRARLLQVQRDFRRLPGLVADGRDMGTIVFPDAQLKIFLTASTEERARRRLNQLNQKGIQIRLESLLQDIEQRDFRDTTRKIAPLVAAEDALIIDSTGINAEDVIKRVLAQARLLFR